MPSRRFVLWFLLLLTATLLVTGCAARSGSGATAAAVATAGADAPLVADLPAFVIDYDADGHPTVAGQPLEQVATFLPPALLNQLILGKATIDALTQANIQHIQISNTPTGLRLLINGQPLPTIVWDGDSLSALLSTLQAAGINPPTETPELLRSFTNMGVGLILRFPRAGAAEPIPYEVQGEASNAAAVQQAVQTFVTTAGARPTIQIPVYYRADGTWTVEGITDTEWQALTGLPFGYVRLRPEWIANAMRTGHTRATLRIDPQGLHLAINGQELPYLSWENGGIKTALGLAQQFGLLKGAPLPPEQLNALVDNWLPALQAAKITIQVYFPPYAANP